MIIEKQQRRPENYRNRIQFYPRARDAFQALLRSLDGEDFTLLLPAFIGVSPKEGSGLYDPVSGLGIRHRFYRVTERLEMDMDALETLLRTVPGRKALLLVHYWGYVDPAYEKAAALAAENGCVLIEDMAHALYTEYVDRRCGRLGDACFYSLHKMFPRETGGMLKLRSGALRLPEPPEAGDGWEPFLCYDLEAIARRRKENARLWESLLKGQEERFTVLRPEAAWGGQTPQTFPVCVEKADRFRLYRDLNEQGYGVVSLYHTMIRPIREGGFPDSLKLSGKILNLPVHQDVSEEAIRALYDRLLPAWERALP